MTDLLRRIQRSLAPDTKDRLPGDDTVARVSESARRKLRRSGMQHKREQSNPAGKIIRLR